MAINKQKIVDLAYNGQGIIGTTLINPGDFYHYEPTAEELRNYDFEAAKILLESAGYQDTNGNGIRESAGQGHPWSLILLPLPITSRRSKAGRMITSDLADAGIKINSVTMDSGALSDKIIAGSYDMFIWGWGSDVDPTVILGVLTTDQIGGNNEPFFSNPKYDEALLLPTGRDGPGEEKTDSSRNAADRIKEVPYLILVYSNNIQAIRSDRWSG